MSSRIALGLLGLAAMATVARGQTRVPAKQQGTPGKHTTAPEHQRFIVAPSGNEARYRVREQLVGLDLPNDAVGATQEVTGSLLVDGKGTVLRDSSKIVVTVTGLKSDKERRDNYIKRRTIESEKFPTVELVPSTFKGLTMLPGSAPSSFELVGDLTVHGVTKPTTWKVTARAEGSDIVGSAVTAFTFKDFGLEQPKVPVVLSVADTIKLEYDFRFTPAPKS